MDESSGTPGLKEPASGNYVKITRGVPVKIVFDPGQNTQISRADMSMEPTLITK